MSPSFKGSNDPETWRSIRETRLDDGEDPTPSKREIAGIPLEHSAGNAPRSWLQQSGKIKTACICLQKCCMLEMHTGRWVVYQATDTTLLVRKRVLRWLAVNPMLKTELCYYRGTHPEKRIMIYGTASVNTTPTRKTTNLFLTSDQARGGDTYHGGT